MKFHALCCTHQHLVSFASASVVVMARRRSKAPRGQASKARRRCLASLGPSGADLSLQLLSLNFTKNDVRSDFSDILGGGPAPLDENDNDVLETELN